MPMELAGAALEAFELREYAEPDLAANKVRIASEFSAAKHGTELAGRKGYAAERGRYDADVGLFVRPAGGAPPPKPSVPGNMTVGSVVEAGADAAGLAVGDRVLTYGGFRQTHVRTAEQCWKLPAELSAISAVCLDPADFAIGAVRDGHVRVGDAVAVFGMGAIGLMAVQIAHVAGASPVIAVEPLPGRRAAAERVGADLVLDPAACDAGLEIKHATGRRGVDVAIEYSGAWQALQAALRSVAYGGTVVAGAFPPPYAAGLDLGAEAHLNIPNIVFSRSCSQPDRDHPRWNEPRAFEVCLALLAAGQISGEHVVTPVVKFEDLPSHYPRIASDPDTYIKLAAEY